MINAGITNVSSPFPNTDQLREMYKDIFDNEAVTALSHWTDAGFCNQRGALFAKNNGASEGVGRSGQMAGI